MHAIRWSQWSDRKLYIYTHASTFYFVLKILNFFKKIAWSLYLLLEILVFDNIPKKSHRINLNITLSEFWGRKKWHQIMYKGCKRWIILVLVWDPVFAILNILLFPISIFFFLLLNLPFYSPSLSLWSSPFANSWVKDHDNSSRTGDRIWSSVPKGDQYQFSSNNWNFETSWYPYYE